MRTVLPLADRLRKIPFPDPTLNTVDSPVEMVYYLGPHVYLGDSLADARIKVWDADKQQWSTDYVGETLDFDKEARTIGFTTTKFAPTALL